MMICVYDNEEDIALKAENARYQHFYSISIIIS